MSKKSRVKAARRAARKAAAFDSGSGSGSSPGSPEVEVVENSPPRGEESTTRNGSSSGVLGGGTGDNESPCHREGTGAGGLDTCYAVPIVQENENIKAKLPGARALERKQKEEKARQEIPTIIALPPPPPLPKSNFTKKEPKSTGKFFQNSQQSSSASNFRDNKPLGLENLGNTCFMNAALQCLSRTKLLIPKLELFGSGEKVSILVSPTEDESKIKISVQNRSKANGNVLGKGDGDKADKETEAELSLPSVNELEICEETETSQKDWKTTPFLISLDISSESMTARLKHTFKAITRQLDSESSNSKEFNSKPGGWHYGFKPHDVHNMIAKNFRPGAQHDSHELLRTIVDMMKKDQTKAFRAAIMKKFGVAKGGEGSDPKMVQLVKSLDQKTKHQTFVDEIFGGELVTVQTCLTCNSSRRSHEEFLDLSLPIRVSKAKESQKPNNNKNKNSSSILSSSFYDNENIVINRTVEQCLSSFIEPELLTGSNVVECESCHRINLAKLENGAAYEDVFPNAAGSGAKHQTPTSSSGTTSKGNTNAENPSAGPGGKKDKKKKRPSRQTRLKNQSQISREEREDLEELLTVSKTKDSELPNYADAAAASSMSIVENHFPVKEPSEGEGSSKGTLEDYVVVSDTEIPTGTCPNNEEPKLDFMQEYDCDDMPPLISAEECAGEEGQGKGIRPLCIVDDILLETESQESGMTVLNENEEDGDANSDDLPSSTDGVWGNVSDDDDDDEGNGVPRLDLDLDLPTYDKFNFFNVPVPCGGSPDALTLVTSPPVELEAEETPEAYVPMTSTSTSEIEMEVEKAAADEGYSEGGNSQDSESVSVKAEAGSTTDAEAVAAAAAIAGVSSIKPLEPLSRGSSSRNSISDPEESSNSNSKDEDETLAASSKIVKKEPPVTKCPCTRQQAISRPPEFLTIHLKRFQISNRGYTSKLSEHIEFPFLLNLTPYCSVVPDEGTDDIFDEDGEVAYSLYGIVEHSGNLHWGHYVAYIKVPEEKAGEKDAWYYISDSHVSSVTETSISDKDPYILFYERVRGDVKKERRQALNEKKNFKYGGYQNGLDSSSTTVPIDTWSSSATASASDVGAGANSGWGGNWEEDQPTNDVQEVIIVEGPKTEAEAEACQGLGLLDQEGGNYENEMSCADANGPMAPLIPLLPFVDDESQNWKAEDKESDDSDDLVIGTLL